MPNEHNGNRAQRYRRLHSVFLEKWAEGLDPLEIGHILGLSRAQLAKHALEAYQAQAERTPPKYSCLPWESLPSQVQKLMPDAKGAIFRVQGDASGVTITISPISSLERA